MTISVGLELAPSAVRVAVLERTHGQTKFRALKEAPWDGSNLEALTRTLAHLRRSVPIAQPVVLGVPGTSSILATVTPLITNARRASLAVEFELQQQLPFELADAVWHYRWFANGSGPALGATMAAGGAPKVSSRVSTVPRPPMSGAVAVAMKRSLFEERVACCRRAGIAVHAVSVSPVAALNAWFAQRNAGRQRAVALIRMVSDQMAEWILWSSTSLHVLSVSGAALEETGRELAAVWESIHGQLPEQPSVWLTGSSAMVPQLQEALRTRGVAQIQQLEIGQIVSPGSIRREESEGAAAALGLALQGLGPVVLPINLLTNLQVQDRARTIQQAAGVASGLFALAAVGLGLNGMLEVRHRRLRILESLTRQERLYQSLRPEIRGMLQRQQHTQRRSLQLEGLMSEAPALTQLLAQVAEALPDTVWLTKLDGSKATVTTPSGGTIVAIEGIIEGRAKSFQDVTQFLDRVKSTAGITAVKPLSTNVVTDAASGKEMVVFTVQIQRTAKP